MSNTNTTTNYYEQESQTSIEKAVLAEDVYFSSLDNVEGKFYLSVMMPTGDTSKPKTKKEGKYKTSNFVKLNIPGYLLLPFMMGKVSKLKVEEPDDTVIGDEGNLSLTFSSKKFRIPKNTVFLACFLGGEFTIEKTCIVGLLTVKF